MEPYGQYGPPTPQNAASGGITGTVKAAVGLTMLAITLAVLEAILAVVMHQNLDNPEVASNPDDIETFRIIFGILIGVNLVISATLAGGAVLAMRRSVPGKVLIWLAGSASMLMRCGCGGIAGIFVYLYQMAGEENDSPLSTGMWGLLLFIEVAGLLSILAAMIMLMTKGASFKDPALAQPGSGYGPPPGYGPPGGPPPGGPNDGLPNLPPSSGWPT